MKSLVFHGIPRILTGILGIVVGAEAPRMSARAVGERFPGRYAPQQLCAVLRRGGLGTPRGVCVHLEGVWDPGESEIRIPLPPTK